jgi:hypothetical protein
MPIVWEINAASLIAVFLNTIWLTIFLIRASDRSIRAEKKADQALDMAQANKDRIIELSGVERSAQKAAECAAECKEKIIILQGAFAAYRETVAQGYVTRDDMRNFEDRMGKAVDKIGDRLSYIIDHRGPVKEQ